MFRFSAGDDPISNPAKWAAANEVTIMSSVNTKPRRRRLKSWIVRQVFSLLRNPSLLKGAIKVGILVYRVYRILKFLTEETPDG